MSTVNEVKKEILRLLTEAKKYPEGSEEYQRVAEDVKNLGQAVQHLRPLDWVKLIEAGLILGLSTLLFIFNLDKVIDSTPLRFIRSLCVKL